MKNLAAATKNNMQTEKSTQASLIIQLKKPKARKWQDHIVCRDRMEAVQLTAQIHDSSDFERGNYTARLISRYVVEQPLDIDADDVFTHADMLGIPYNCNGR